MATREISKDPKRKNKEVLQEVPIKYFASSLEGVVPDIPGHENLPPLQLASYITVTPTFMPQISFQQIYQHMILRKTTDGKEVNNHRGLDRAIKHFEAGDISQVMIAQIDDSVDYIRGSCLASMKKIKYHVYICVENKQKVCFAYCECPIGLAQSCSHIGGLLFYIHHLQLSEKLMSDSATSKSCQWNVPRPMKMEPKPLKDWNLSRPKLSSEGQVEFREKKQIDFDPRHPDQREFQLAHSIEQLKILKKIFPKTGMCHLWMIPDETPEVVKEVEVQTSEDPMEMAMKALILSKENLPMAISIDENLSLFIEERTQGQRCCPIWRELHKGRITSSLFGAVLGSGANPNSLVDQIIKGSGLDRYQSLPKAIQWGIDHEKEALQDYLCLQNCVTNLTVEPSGLTIYPSHAFLGASSDGWIYDKSMPVGNQKGVLEIKCPYSISNEVITDREVHELAGQGGFCLEMTDEGPRLKRSHKYYAQIQGEMAIMGCSWGDFVVWTAASQSNCFIERVYFDVTFVTSMMPKLVEFFVSYISPSYTK